MTTLNRRSLILGASALAIGAVLGTRLSPRERGPAVAPTVETIQAFLAEEFGEAVGASAETLRFAEAVIGFAEDDVPEREIVFAFIRSTNVIRALETGDDLVFLSIAPPVIAPCQNTLSAAWL